MRTAKKKTINTYSKKNVLKPKKKNTNIIIHQTIVNNYHTSIINNIFVTSRSGSGDEFDKLLKGPVYCKPQQPSFSFCDKKVFQERQETFSYYNSDATPGSLSISSGNLFKDKESPDLYSLSHLPTPPKYEKKKNKLVKIVTRQKEGPARGVVKKKKRRKTICFDESSCESKTLDAVSSTPTHPRVSQSRNQWIDLPVSPIMPPTCTTCNDSSRDIFAVEQDQENESVADTKSDLGMSDLLKGFGNLGIVTPCVKAKESVWEIQSCKMEPNETSHSQWNISTNETHNIPTSEREKTEPVNKQLLKVEDSSDTREMSNIVDEAASKNSLQCQWNKKVFCAKSDSKRKQTKSELVRTNITTRRKTCLDYSFLNYKGLESSKVLQNESYEKQADTGSNKGFVVDVEHGHCSSDIGKQNLDPLNDDSSSVTASKVAVWMSLSSAPISINQSNQINQDIDIDVCTSTNTMKKHLDDDIKEEPQVEMDNASICSNVLEETRLNLIPGKRWRRSYSLHKRSVKQRCTMEPNLLAKLIKDANTNNISNMSCNLPTTSTTEVNNASLLETSINSSILNSTLEFLKKVSIRGKKKIDRFSCFQNCNFSLHNIPEESSSPVLDEASVSKVQSEQPLEISTADFKSPRERQENRSMDQIPEESLFENSNTNLEDSTSSELVGTPAGDKKNRFKPAETPPLFPMNIEELGTITKRRKPSRTSEEYSQLPEHSVVEDQVSYYEPSLSGSLNSDSSSDDGISDGDRNVTFLSLFEDEKELGELIKKMDEDEFRKMGEVGVLLRCGLQQPLPFSEAFPDEVLLHCQKIGEGVYGEVFMLERPHGRTVLKIIPVEGSQLVNNEHQKFFHEVLSELIITEELSSLREDSQNCTSGFCELKNKFCLQGSYPKRLVDLWNEYDAKKKSENDCPDMFGSDQLYIALELAHSGEPVESYRFSSAKQAYSVFLQTAFSMAIAEFSLEFEHRDLHVGNVLVKSTTKDYIDFVFNSYKFKLPTYGTKATIIDFTLSRLLYKDEVLFFDMATDPELFTAEGDYQFDIYRHMKADLDNVWRCHAPVTNVRWLHYLIDKFILGVKYLNKKTKSHARYLDQLNSMKEKLLDFLSSSDLAEFFLQTYTETIAIIKEVS